MAILGFVREWEPFSIDALGVVTLLGAESLQQALGRLVVTPFAEYFPLLAAQVVFEGTIAEPIPGFTVYNITDDIKSTSVSGWWARWLLSQDLTKASTTFELSHASSHQRHSTIQYASMLVACMVNAFLIVFPVLLGDWYGLACAVSIAVDVVVRTAIMGMYRDGLDANMRKAAKYPHPVKLFVSLPAGGVVTVYTTRGITVRALLTEPTPTPARLLKACHQLGWLSFAVYIVTMGMSCLTMQLVFVACILVPSAMVIRRVGCDEYRVGGLLAIHRADLPGQEHMAQTLAALRLADREEQAMIDWGFFPRRSNTRWWGHYKACEADYHTNPGAFDDWRSKLDTKTPPGHTDELDQHFEQMLDD